MPYIRRAPIWSDPRVKPPYGSVRVDRAHPLAIGLTTDLPFDEGAGTTIRNRAIGDDVSWTASGPTWGVGLGERALQWDNTDKTINSSTVFDYGTRFTIAAHVVSDLVNSAYHAICRHKTNAVALYLNNANKFSELSGIDAEMAGTTVVRAGALYQVVVTVDAPGNTRSIFVNGVQENTATSAQTAGSGNVNQIGRDDFAQYWSGSMFFWRKWSRPLAPSEVLWLYAEPYAFFRPIISRRYFVPQVVGIYSHRQILIGVGA